LTDAIRSILIISDIHAGSPYSVCTRAGIPVDVGNEVNWVMPNKLQHELHSKWEYMVTIADNFNVDTVFNLGDTIDGADYKNGGQGVMTPIIDAQVELASELLKPVVKDRKYVSVSSSPYHSSRDTKSELAVTKELRGYAEETMFLGVTGIVTIPEINKKINLAHKASNAMLYTATMADRELIYWNVAAAREQLPKIDWIIRGHLHKFYHLDNGCEHFLQSACWKSWYPIKSSTNMIGRYQTDIGFSVLQFDEAGRSNLRNFIYPSPNIAIKEVDV